MIRVLRHNKSFSFVPSVRDIGSLSTKFLIIILYLFNSMKWTMGITLKQQR